MKIKIKGSDKVKTINPNEWSVIEKNGQTSEYEVIERNTVWAAPIDSNGKIAESQKREFELDHWHKLLDLGSKNKWKKVEIEQSEIKGPKTEVKEPIKTEQKDKNIEISDLQVELTQAQIEKTNAETDLTKEKTKDLKRKFLYFIGGVIVGNIDTILKLLRLIDLS